MKRALLPFLFCFVSLTATSIAQFRVIENGSGRTYCDDVAISGFYHPEVSIGSVLLPQVPLIHNYNHTSMHRMYYASQQKLPLALKEQLKQVIDFEENEPEFYISIQSGTDNPVKADGTYKPFDKDVDNIRPHYALFKDATVENPQIRNASYNQAENFEETFILPVMRNDLSLTATEGNVSAHPAAEPPETVLSGNSYILEGDRRIPWLFFSYFRTTEGRQLLTLHYVVDEAGRMALYEHFGNANGAPLTTTREVFDLLKRTLNNPSIDAISEIVLNGRLTDFAQEKLEIAIAQKQHIDRTLGAIDRFEKLENERKSFKRPVNIEKGKLKHIIPPTRKLI
jgi:hypothetical protein